LQQRARPWLGLESIREAENPGQERTNAGYKQ